MRKPYVIHFIAQVSYLLLLVYRLHWSRYLDWYVLSLLYGITLYGIFPLLFPRSGPNKILLSLSPLVITTSVFLFLTGDALSTYLLAITVAIGTRFLIRIGGRNVFNPSAIAIIFMVAWGEGVKAQPTVLGNNPWWLAYFFTIGVITSFSANRIIASFSYLFGMIGLLVLSWFLGFQAAPLHLGSLMSVSICLIAFHVLTDPQTSPSSKQKQVLFGLTIALLDLLFRMIWIFQSSMLALTATYALFALWERRQEVFFKRLIPAAFLSGIVLVGMRWGYYPTPNTAVYSDAESFQKRRPIPAAEIPVHYRDIANELGLNRRPAYLGSVKGAAAHKRSVYSPPSLAVADFDGDGFEDLLVGGAKGNFALYKNEKGKTFRDVTEEVGLGGANLRSAAFFDYDNDGKKDIVGIDGANEFKLFRNEGGHFVDVTKKLHLPEKNFGGVHSIGFLDYDQDGYLDIIVANFPNLETAPIPRGTGPQDAAFNGYKKNYLLKNHHGEFFSDETDAMGLVDKKFTHAIGITDMNGDGYPDIYVANSFDRDDVFLNRGGKSFENVTKQALGNIHQRFGMSVEIADVEATGRQEIYVTNVTGTFNRRGVNYLWAPGSEAASFTNEADQRDLGRCAVSWGAKFFDADLDGNLDLFVVGGLVKGDNPSWFLALTSSSLPTFIKGRKEILSSFPPSPDLGGHVRNCFFWKHDGKFIDIAEEVGLSDTLDSYSIALIDMKNDGHPIALVGTFGGLVRAFQPTSMKKNNWVGIQLEATLANRDGLGARVSLLHRKAPVKELYPSNGIASEGDPRMIFGLGENVSGPIDAQVIWPGGFTQIVRNLKPNAYNKIRETR